MILYYSRRFIKPLWFPVDRFAIDPLAYGSIKLDIIGSSNTLHTFERRGELIGQRNEETGEVAIDLQASYPIDVASKGLIRIALPAEAAQHIRRSDDPAFDYELTLDGIEFVDVTAENMIQGLRSAH